MSPGTENPQSHLELDARYDAVFPCDLCAFVAHGPGELEQHQAAAHAVPVGAVDAIPVHAANAVSAPKKRGRPKREHA